MIEKVSIIIPCRNEKGYLREMLESFKITKGNLLAELIIVDDGSSDGSCDFLGQQEFKYPWPVKLIKTKNLGPARARNLGAKDAKGDVLLFCDAHLLVDDPDWIGKILAELEERDIGAACPGIATIDIGGATGYGGTLDENLSFCWLTKPIGVSDVPIGPGGCIAVKKGVFRDIYGFEENFPAWGYEDIEISIKMWLFGYRIVVTPAVKVFHVFRSKHPYPIKYADVDYNLLWLTICHFSQQRLLKVVELVNKRQELAFNLQRLYQSNVWEQSREYRIKRKFEDDWYFEKFKIPF